MCFTQRLVSLLFIGIIPSRDIVVFQDVRILRRRNNAKEILQLLLLQIPLRQVFELTLRELEVLRRGNRQFGLVARDHNIVCGKLTGLSTDFDLFLQIFLKHGDIENLVFDWLRAVDDKFDSFLSLDL